MSWLPSTLPFFVVVVALALIVAAVRLHARLSVPMRSAGNWHQEQPPKPGVKETPPQLRSIDGQVLAWMSTRPGAPQRQELAATMNQLLDAVYASDYDALSSRSTTEDLISVLDRLEAELALPPLEGNP